LVFLNLTLKLFFIETQFSYISYGKELNFILWA